MEERDIEFESQFPMEIEVAFHDDATPHDREIIAEKLELDDDHQTVEQIAGLGYEITMTVKVNNEYDWEVVEVFGKELKEPHSF